MPSVPPCRWFQFWLRTLLLLSVAFSYLWCAAAWGQATSTSGLAGVAASTAPPDDSPYTLQYAITIPGQKLRLESPNTAEPDYENPRLIGRVYTNRDYNKYVYVFFREQHYPSLAEANRDFHWEPRDVRACIGNDGSNSWYADFGEDEIPNPRHPATLSRASVAELRKEDMSSKVVPADTTAQYAVLNKKTGVWVRQQPDWIVFVQLHDQIRRIAALRSENNGSLPPASKLWKEILSESDERLIYVYQPKPIAVEGLPPHVQPHEGGMWRCSLFWNKKSAAIDSVQIGWAPEMFFGAWQYPYPFRFSIVGPTAPIPERDRQSVRWATDTRNPPRPPDKHFDSPTTSQE